MRVTECGGHDVGAEAVRQQQQHMLELGIRKPVIIANLFQPPWPQAFWRELERSEDVVVLEDKERLERDPHMWSQQQSLELDEAFAAHTKGVQANSNGNIGVVQQRPHPLIGQEVLDIVDGCA